MKVIVPLIVILSLVVAALLIWLVLHKRNSTRPRRHHSSQNSLTEDVHVPPSTTTTTEISRFCQDVLPHLTSLDDPDTLQLLKGKLKPWEYVWLLPGSDLSCKNASEESLGNLRQKAKEILQDGDAFCQESETKMDPKREREYKQIINEPSLEGGYRVQSLYATLMIARLFQTVKCYMMASDQERSKLYHLVRFELAAWRAASGMPHLGCPRTLTAHIYDLDSAIRYFLLSNDQWLSKDEKQTFIQRESQQCNLKEEYKTYLELMRACAESGQDCYSLGKAVYRFLRLQNHSELEVVGKYLRENVPTQPSGIIPLKWYERNCGIQVAILSLAPVQDDLDFPYVTIPKLQSQNSPFLIIYTSLMDTLSIINKRKDAPEIPYGFPELHKVLITKPEDGQFMGYYNTSKVEENVKDLLSHIIHSCLDSRPFEDNRLYESPFCLWMYDIHYNSSSDSDKSEKVFVFDDNLGILDVSLNLHSKLSLESLFNQTMPQGQHRFMSGPKLLFAFGSNEYNTATSMMEACPLPVTEVWTPSINVGDQQTGEIFITMKYVLRSAIFYSSDHYSSMLHYGGVHSKDQWFWCTLSVCEPGLFDFPTGIRPDGKNKVIGVVYERVD